MMIFSTSGAANDVTYGVVQKKIAH